jgi:hypothetical protein
MPFLLAAAEKRGKGEQPEESAEMSRGTGNRSTFGPGALLLPKSPSPLLRRGIERIQAKSGSAVDLLHGSTLKELAGRKYGWVVVLKNRARVAGDKLEDDAWTLSVSDDSPRTISIKAKTGRAQLFAIYHIARCLELGTPFADWAASRKPRIAKRYAWISAGNNSSPVLRTDWFDDGVTELPAMGFNGILLNCNNTQGTSIGRQTIPLKLTMKGVVVDRYKLPPFLKLFDKLKSYGLDISLYHQAYVPPGFNPDDVRACYAGKRRLPGLLKAIRENSYRMASAVFTNMPQVDSLFHHSVECPWMWEGGISIFPAKNEKAAERAFDAYLAGLTKACKEHGKDLMFWTHVSAVPARQIRLIHEVLARHPSVIVIEDHAWPNSTWAFTPIMGHVEEKVLMKTTAGRWGMTIVTTDGEFYGAGALPTAFPEPHVRSARTMVKRGAECGIVRVNPQAMTPLSTLEDCNGINVIATAEEWWASPRPLERQWHDWCASRFGKAAAPAVVAALKQSETIVVKGLSASGLSLLDHSALAVHAWDPEGRRLKPKLFDDPGKLLLNKTYEQLENGIEFSAWLVKARGMTLEAFLKDNDQAQAAARDALEKIESVRRHLAPEDYAYLTRCFGDAVVMMEVLRRIAVGLDAVARCRKNGGKEARQDLKKACSAMEKMADRIQKEHGINFFKTKFFFKTRYRGKEYKGYGAPIALRQIALMYRRLAALKK